MSHELSEIRIIRKKLGISQIELASHSGVSQSLIAKVESGSLDPSYSNAQKIFGALDSLSKHKSLKVSDVMQKKIISIGPNENMKDAVQLMKKHQISQIPVIEDNNSIGLISESSILDALMNGKSGKVKDVMVDSLPVVSKDATIDAISDLLRFYPITLVSEKGKLVGVVTKSDIISRI